MKNMTEREWSALLEVAGEKLMTAFETVNGDAYVLWLNILCKLAAEKGAACNGTV